MDRLQYASNGCPRGGRGSWASPPEHHLGANTVTFLQHTLKVLDTNCRPTNHIFIVLSLAFGGLIICGTPPLRGPDEIPHFVRIYSYARGQPLPTTEVDGRKGIFESLGCIAKCSFSGPQEKCLRGKTVFVTRSSWRGIDNRLVLQLRTKPTKRRFSLHLRAPKATTRSHTFPILLPQR